MSSCALLAPRGGRTDLRGVGLVGQGGRPHWHLLGVVIARERLVRVHAPYARWREVDATAVDVTEAYLPHADLADVRLAHARLGKANLEHGRLARVDLGGVDAEGAQLLGLHLTECELSAARLVDADLRGARLTGVCLAGADLRGADLTGALLFDCDLRFADLRGAKGLSLPRVNLERSGAWLEPVTPGWPLSAAVADRTST